MGQKKRAKRENEIREQEELINSFRRASTKYEEALNTNLTVLQMGHKTMLFTRLLEGLLAGADKKERQSEPFTIRGTHMV
jgi:hypothetical protein